MELSDDEWKNKLSEEEYQILRKKATEAPFSGEYTENKETGEYHCAGCGKPLFSSKEKYDSGSGWPSFTQAKKEAVEYEIDHKLPYPRTEVHCANCKGHLGHVFDDGPSLEGKRYCINSRALKFEKKE